MKTDLTMSGPFFDYKTHVCSKTEIDKMGNKKLVILITGVSSGFGKSMARKLAADGHKVYGTVRREVEQLPGTNYIKADVTDEKTVEAAVAEVLAAEGKIDIFINNAGMGIGGPLEFNAIADIEKQMDTNFMGMARFLHYVVPAMRRQKAGKIICISSIGGLMGLPFQGAYSASKFAIEGYCEALRLELKGTGVKVVVIEPGDFSTGFTSARNSVRDDAAFEAYPSYAKAFACIEHDETHGLKPEVLAEKISRIIGKKNPAHHYIVATFIQRISVLIKRLVPSRWYAWFLGLYYHL